MLFLDIILVDWGLDLCNVVVFLGFRILFMIIIHLLIESCWSGLISYIFAYILVVCYMEVYGFIVVYFCTNLINRDNIGKFLDAIIFSRRVFNDFVKNWILIIEVPECVRFSTWFFDGFCELLCFQSLCGCAECDDGVLWNSCFVLCCVICSHVYDILRFYV